MSNTSITVEEILSSKTVTIIEDDAVPAIGTPHRASWEANQASGVRDDSL